MNIISHSAESTTLDHRKRYHTVLGCPSCARLTLIEHSPPNSRPNEIYKVAPESPDEAMSVRHLPSDVAKYFIDARRAIDADIPDAAAVQLRRTLEAAAKHYDISESNLMRSITKLIEDGHVTKSFSGALHHVRVVGNQGAHAGDESVSEDQAALAFQFTTQLLRNLFEVPGELQLLAQRSDDSAQH